jgi:hypothetical protein
MGWILLILFDVCLVWLGLGIYVIYKLNQDDRWPYRPQDKDGL